MKMLPQHFFVSVAIIAFPSSWAKHV